MPPPSQSATLDGLPKPFVGALRTLFDIMDDKGAGFVKFSEIERRWQDDGTKGLPKGVIESLRKVTPPNGLLSFERFCAGLKICLLRNQVESRQPSRPPSAPLLDMDKPQWNSSNTATVRPNNAMAQQRTLSMPQLPGDQKDTVGIPVVKSPPLYGPPKPPRTAAGLERAMQLAASERERAGGLDKQEIRTALQNWQLGVMMGDQEEKRMAYSRGRSIGDGKPAVVAEPQQVLPHKKGSSRRREPRRHTLQNGIDYNMLKRMKQIEQEKDVLMQGLQAVEKARDWYLKQVAAVQEKMKYLGRMGSHMSCVTKLRRLFDREFGWIQLCMYTSVSNNEFLQCSLPWSLGPAEWHTGRKGITTNFCNAVFHGILDQQSGTQAGRVSQRISAILSSMESWTSRAAHRQERITTNFCNAVFHGILDQQSDTQAGRVSQRISAILSSMESSTSRAAQRQERITTNFCNAVFHGVLDQQSGTQAGAYHNEFL
ncbi:negative regulation of protein localization to cell cortex [Homalodisca vitripennis]|nr:negative regulation of protein localization to cell cortex [Homalodisca vitripennis]